MLWHRLRPDYYLKYGIRPYNDRFIAKLLLLLHSLSSFRSNSIWKFIYLKTLLARGWTVHKLCKMTHTMWQYWKGPLRVEYCLTALNCCSIYLLSEILNPKTVGTITQTCRFGWIRLGIVVNTIYRYFAKFQRPFEDL